MLSKVFEQYLTRELCFVVVRMKLFGDTDFYNRYQSDLSRAEQMIHCVCFFMRDFFICQGEDRQQYLFVLTTLLVLFAVVKVVDERTSRKKAGTTIKAFLVRSFSVTRPKRSLCT